MSENLEKVLKLPPLAAIPVDSCLFIPPSFDNSVSEIATDEKQYDQSISSTQTIKFEVTSSEKAWIDLSKSFFIVTVKVRDKQGDKPDCELYY